MAKETIDIQLLDGTNDVLKWMKALSYISDFQENHYDPESEAFFPQLKQHIEDTAGIEILCSCLSEEKLEEYQQILVDNGYNPDTTAFVRLLCIMVVASLMIHDFNLGEW